MFCAEKVMETSVMCPIKFEKATKLLKVFIRNLLLEIYVLDVHVCRTSEKDNNYKVLCGNH